MRILAIGLGGAGTRIVDNLYDHDLRSKVGCMSTIAIDTDSNTLLQLQFLPDNMKLYFPPIDPLQHYDTNSTIDIEEIMTAIQKVETVDIDSIMIFCGLGGNMADAVSLIVPEIRKSFIEPVFAFATLPCRSEGKKRSAKAAESVEMIQSHVDALLLFDNDTWYHKFKTSANLREQLGNVEVPGTQIRLPLKAGKFPDNPRDIYRLLNERISRHIGLLLRAGEFNEEGLEVAEVVLDAGEVLNTLKGNGIVAVGYAIEALPWSWLNIFDRWRSERYFMEGAHERAARIVSLAKKAVYEDISIPCDLTSADKALVLIAGPSRELSMKGFQTVRKWIDRSIAGMEMRSGDYPVKNTRYVGIIIMLSGLDNIPRISELNQIKAEYEMELLDEEKRKEEEAIREMTESEYPEDIVYEELPMATLDTEDDALDTESRGTEEESEDNTDSSEMPFDLWEDDDEDEVSPVAPEDCEEDEVPPPILPKDDTIILPGSKSPKSSPSRMKDDAIVLVGKKTEKTSQDSQINMPGKPDRVELDMTRSTDGGDRLAPKNSVFGLKDINASWKYPRAEKKAKEGFQVTTMPKANDRIIDGENISFQPSFTRMKEGIIDGDTVKVAPHGKKIRELMSQDDGLTMTKPKIRTREFGNHQPEVKVASKGGKTRESLQNDSPVKLKSGRERKEDNVLARAERTLKSGGVTAKEPKTPLRGYGITITPEERPPESVKKKKEDSSSDVIDWIA
jgi:cell division GTPase FtsZ